MALKIHKNALSLLVAALAVEIKRLRVAAVSTNVHLCAAQSSNLNGYPPTVSALQVTAADATDLASSLVLGNQIIGFYIQHFADVEAHKVVDATALPAVGACIDLTTAIAAMTLLKATHATHIASTTQHYTADGTNTLLTTTPSNQATLNTFVNAAKVAINAHTAAALAGFNIQPTDS